MSDIPEDDQYPIQNVLYLATTENYKLIYSPRCIDETTAGGISWQMEFQGMLCNDPCSPNAIDDSHNRAKGEVYAAWDIMQGEELCYDHCLQYYNHGPFLG
eukprot:3680693-Ditylum_brightwellii.AAC.1